MSNVVEEVFFRPLVGTDRGRGKKRRYGHKEK
jgi:hypothetical protein